MLGFSRPFETVEVQQSQPRNLHSMAKHMPGQFENSEKFWNEKSNSIRCRSENWRKWKEKEKNSCLHDSQRQTDQMMRTISLYFLFCRKVPCIDKSNYTSHWSRYQKVFSKWVKVYWNTSQASLIKWCNNMAKQNQLLVQRQNLIPTGAKIWLVFRWVYGNIPSCISCILPLNMG